MSSKWMREYTILQVASLVSGLESASLLWRRWVESYFANKGHESWGWFFSTQLVEKHSLMAFCEQAIFWIVPQVLELLCELFRYFSSSYSSVSQHDHRGHYSHGTEHPGNHISMNSHPVRPTHNRTSNTSHYTYADRVLHFGGRDDRHLASNNSSLISDSHLMDSRHHHMLDRHLDSTKLWQRLVDSPRKSGLPPEDTSAPPVPPSPASPANRAASIFTYTENRDAQMDNLNPKKGYWFFFKWHEMPFPVVLKATSVQHCQKCHYCHRQRDSFSLNIKKKPM